MQPVDQSTPNEVLQARQVRDIGKAIAAARETGNHALVSALREVAQERRARRRARRKTR